MTIDQSDLNLPGKTATPQEWKTWCLARLDVHEEASNHDPLANSVRRLAYDIFRVQEASASADRDLAATAKILCDEALIARAEEFANAHEDGAIDDAFIETLLAPLASASFEVVQQEIERTHGGIVFTAHPTFAMSSALRTAVAAYACASNDKQRAEAKASIAKLPHAPDEPITLKHEHAASQAAIKRAQSTLRDFTAKILTWARRRFPDQWRELAPTPISVATWVGYDLDGRTDIHWGETFRIRLEEKSRGLDAYAKALSASDLKTRNSKRDALISKLKAASEFAREQADLFAGDLDDPTVVTRAANMLTSDDPRKLVSLEKIIADIGKLIEETPDDDACMPLCVLRAEMKNFGLGCARIHLRINAAQVKSALRADLGIEQGRNFIDRTALTAAVERAQSVTKRRINVASIFLEQMTARRQLMLCAEFIKHIDGDTPIRFLIAECEAPATVMGTIYLAKLYGVEHRLDISPLFETPEAMERGGRFIERLLAQDEFVDYIRTRGRLAVQIGFSDSGRFMGQIAANLAIERLQISLARALAAKGITDVEVLIFNTHGESMGRGAYPGSLNERFDYLMTPWTRARFAHEKLKTNVEASFQGGDGFMHFETDHLARATIAAFVRWSFTPTRADLGDQFYADINYSWDFYRSVKSWQEHLFDNADYQIAIGAFAPNLLFSTGSRKSRRQSGAVVTGPRAMRAIPHNAILQQLAAPANVFGGVGDAAGAEPDRIVDHIRGSGRMQEIIGIVRNARRLTSLPAMRAYAVLFDASFWINKAARTDDLATAQACEELATRLGDQAIATALERLSNHYAADLAKLDRILSEIDGDESREERYISRRTMHVLHAIRQAAIMRAFILVAGLPHFSQRHDCTRETVIDLAIELRFGELADLLDTVFPDTQAMSASFQGITEESDDQSDSIHGYPEIQDGVIVPLRNIHQLIREIGVGVAHHYGAYG